jgi:hypothetical protein
MTTDRSAALDTARYRRGRIEGDRLTPRLGRCRQQRPETALLRCREAQLLDVRTRQ